MTTHVFIVDGTTFKYHLEYMFAGTGAKDNDVDFNGTSYTSLHPTTEKCLVGLMADCCRIRKGDHILFYLQARENKEGRFYGIFQASSEPFLDNKDKHQFLADQLNKNLTFRVLIRPYEVYGKGVTEWQALDEIKNISCPCQMLWSLIYRKLKGNRGNTMITIYEAERLCELIRKENNYLPLPISNTYSIYEEEISIASTNSNYTGRKIPLNILPRMIYKINRGQAHEAHLQAFCAQQITKGTDLDKALGIDRDSVEWIGNEVACGVGMQRIDLMVSKAVDDCRRIIIPIELKDEKVKTSILNQLDRYIDWIEQYYIPNRISTIQPAVICKHGGLKQTVIDSFHAFNQKAQGRYLPLIYIEYSLVGNNISFNSIPY
ncbi:MAG: hypothetical protein IKX28_06715 [Bacteroidales bacterium]|nr:hypothetical protein [Bacteroidales bacterium]